MLDLKVIYVRDVVPVRRASLIKTDPPTLQLYGEDFSTAYAVVVNGIEYTDFTVQTKNNIILTIGSELQGKRLTIDVFSESFTTTKASFLEPRLTTMPQWTFGLHKLVQQFVKVMLTTPGTSLHRRSEGGGMQKVAGATVKLQDIPILSTRVMTAINRATEQVKTSQSRAGIPPDERLQSVEVIDVAFDPQTVGLNVRLLLNSEAGQAALANLGLSAAPDPTIGPVSSAGALGSGGS